MMLFPQGLCGTANDSKIIIISLLFFIYILYNKTISELKLKLIKYISFQKMQLREIQLTKSIKIDQIYLSDSRILCHQIKVF